MKYFVAFTFLIVLSNCSFAQTDSLKSKLKSIQISGFLDVYYGFDFNQPQSELRQPFLFNYNRHNSFSLNLGKIKFSVEDSSYRASLAFHTGTYVNDNYSSQLGLLKSVSEASVGFALNKNKKIWLDVGILPSHIGFESAVSADNWTLTRSLLAENSPYYMAGAKVTWNPTDKVELAAIVCNGWQAIKRLNGNSLLSFGSQIMLKPTKKVVINWSTFIGTDDPDSLRRMRYFNNFYGSIKLTKKLSFLAGFDHGMQQVSKKSNAYHFWHSAVLLAKYAFNPKLTATFRAEYYEDKNSTKIVIPTFNSFNASGLSLNFDYTPFPDVFLRIESRWLNSRDKLYTKQDSFVRNNLFIVASLAIKFAN